MVTQIKITKQKLVLKYKVVRCFVFQNQIKKIPHRFRIIYDLPVGGVHHHVRDYRRRGRGNAFSLVAVHPPPWEGGEGHRATPAHTTNNYSTDY